MFDSSSWQTPAPGARFKAFRNQARQIRLLELTPEFVEADWCEKGHAGIVLQGELELEFHDRVVRFPEGAVIVIPAGTASGHKARSITPMVQLFLVEDL